MDSNKATSIFGTLMALIVFLTILKTIIFSAAIKRLNIWLHNKMIASLLFTNMQFFYANDPGKVLHFHFSIISSDRSLKKRTNDLYRKNIE